MAEEYIRWVKGLSRRREVLVLARELNMSRREAACCCMEIWEWADEETTDGHIVGVTLDFVDGIIGVPGFARAMCAPNVVWLVEKPDGIFFPRWEKNNGKCAKLREYERRKKRQQRELGAKKKRKKRPQIVPENVPENVPVCPGEKTGFLFSLSLSSPLPLILNKEEFKTALGEWIDYKTARKEAYSEIGFKKQISLAEKRANEFGLAALIGAIEKAIAENWKGWDHEGSFSGGGARLSSDPRGNLRAAQLAMEKINAES